MKIIFIIYYIAISTIKSSIIPVKYTYINNQMTFQIKKSKQIVNCLVSTSTPNNYIPLHINDQSQSKRKNDYNDPNFSIFDEFKGKTPVMKYDDWFFIEKNEFIMKYYVDQKINICIISFSKSSNENLISALYINKKINNTVFGIKSDEENDNSGILYLGGLPEKEKKGLDLYIYKYSFFQNFFEKNKWYLPIESGSLQTKTNTFNINLFCEGYISTLKEEIFIPPIFNEFLYNNIMGFYIKQESWNYENKNLFCDCKTLNEIKGFEKIYLKIDELRLEFKIEDIFVNKGEKCFFAFKVHNENYFILGKNFWKKYKMEFFQNEKIILYSKKKFIIEKTSSFINSKMYIIIFFIIICTICFFCCYSSEKIKNKND